MKATLLFTTLSMALTLPQAFAVTELETLRARCNEQERQIQYLEEQVQKLQSRGTAQAVPTSHTAVVSSTNTPSAATHTVRAGDSLEKIARRAGCSVETLAQANGLKLSSVIRPGQKLNLPSQAAPRTEPQTISEKAPEVPSSASMAGRTHKIQKGETLAGIARKNGIPLGTLIAANPDLKPTALRPGQMIRLSTGDTDAVAHEKPIHQTASTPAASRTLKSTPIMAEKSPATQSAPPSAPAKPAETTAKNPTPEQTLSPSKTEKKIRTVTIEGEMTYGEFAANHGTDTNRLNDLNGLDLTNATVLAKGSELYVPAQP